MLKIRFVQVVLLLLLTSSAFAQKVKYKDIFALLSANQYGQAEPFLKTYLKDNTENPNAYLYMGLIYKEKAEAEDVLLNTGRCIQRMDSAILFFDKALKGIDDKEIRKNKEYYVNYTKRDLRTGEFGVKLSDVQFDLEKKISSLRERIDKVKMIKHYFSNAESLYKRSFELFAVIQKSFPGERELYLRANEAMITNLTDLSLRFDSCSKMFENYKGSLGNLEKTGYNQTWNLTEISNFKSDGNTMTDFYKDDVKVWDYKKFATKSLTIIEKDVKPT